MYLCKKLFIVYMKFEDYYIAPDIKKNLEKLGFKRPTDIQFKAIPPILKGEDVLGIAQTGTGKTAAFAIPVIHKIYEINKRSRSEGIKAIVMVPTRELAIQITEVFNKLANHTKVKTFSVFGGVEQGPQIAKLEKGIDILVATPGRMFDLVSQGHINLSRIQILILDEADHMLNLGFIKDIQDLIRFLPKKRQTLFFSATIDKNIKKLSYSLVNNPIRIQISPKDPVARNIHHSVAFIEMDDKRFFLERFVSENDDMKILVFVRTKIRAERVQKAMERVQIASKTIHGDKTQKDRLAVLEEFKSGKTMVLIATDVSARGLDIPNVDFVINYDLPEQAENYVHRVGRTGRGKQKGQAIAFCAKEERELLQQIEEYTGNAIEELIIKKNEYIEIVDSSPQSENDWKSLITNNEEFAKTKKKPKKKK